MLHIMRAKKVFWLMGMVLVLVEGAPKSSSEDVAHGNKDIDDPEDLNIDLQPTPIPSDLPVDLPENWDQTKDDSQSLFINKNDKNDLEPYPMALSDDADSYDGQPIYVKDDKPKPGALEHVLMRAEFYGEPPSMGRQPSRKKRAGPKPFRSGNYMGGAQTLSKANKKASRYSAIRMKRDVGMSDELRTLLTLWNAEQQRIKEEKESYYNPSSFYNQYEPYEDNSDGSSYGDVWLDEPVLTPSHFSNYYDFEKPHYKYPQTYSDYKVEEPEYFQHLEALRRKRQWAGKTHQSKRFMVAKKRSEPNQYYYSQKSYKPREDLYTLNELLKSTQHARDQGIPISRRMIL